MDLLKNVILQMSNGIDILIHLKLKCKNENIKSSLDENEQEGYHVVLKSLKNSSNVNKEFLNEVSY